MAQDPFLAGLLEMASYSARRKLGENEVKFAATVALSEFHVACLIDSENPIYHRDHRSVTTLIALDLLASIIMCVLLKEAKHEFQPLEICASQVFLKSSFSQEEILSMTRTGHDAAWELMKNTGQSEQVSKFVESVSNTVQAYCLGRNREILKQYPVIYRYLREAFHPVPKVN